MHNGIEHLRNCSLCFSNVIQLNPGITIVIVIKKTSKRKKERKNEENEKNWSKVE